MQNLVETVKISTLCTEVSMQRSIFYLFFLLTHKKSISHHEKNVNSYLILFYIQKIPPCNEIFILSTHDIHVLLVLSKVKQTTYWHMWTVLVSRTKIMIIVFFVNFWTVEILVGKLLLEGPGNHRGRVSCRLGRSLGL